MTLHTKTQAVLGIDPGKSGAFALISPGNEQVSVHDFTEFNDVVKLLSGYDIRHAFIEKVHAMPGQGVCSMFSFGENFGTWKGILIALQIPFTQVAPQTWKKSMLKDMPKEKSSSVQRCLQLYPQMVDSFKRKKDHNRADAILIASYGKLVLKI